MTTKRELGKITKSPRTGGPVSKFTPRPVDQDLYRKLMDILHEDALDYNFSATARVLGINRRTAQAWYKHPPDNPWINTILREAIIQVYYFLYNSKHKKFRKRAAIVRGSLHRLKLSELKEVIEENEANQSEAIKHLLITINEAPGQQISTRDLRLPAYNGGYSMRALRQAADVLMLDKVTQGFGEHKETFYRIPFSDSP